MNTTEQHASTLGPQWFDVEIIASRWVLREAKARWLVLSVPDRPHQHAVYRRSGIGWRPCDMRQGNVYHPDHAPCSAAHTQAETVRKQNTPRLPKPRPNPAA